MWSNIAMYGSTLQREFEDLAPKLNADKCTVEMSWTIVF